MLEVICGPMFSGKSEELVRRLTRHKIGRRTVVAYKPQIDNRYGVETINSHSGFEFPCMPLPVGFNTRDKVNFIELAWEADVVGFDEVQFFGPEFIVSLVKGLTEAGKTVIAAGLDKDFRQNPFGHGIMTLLALADKVDKFPAVCHSCGDDAFYTQRLLDGKPASFDGPTVVVGGLDTYEARCRRCFERG